MQAFILLSLKGRVPQITVCLGTHLVPLCHPVGLGNKRTNINMVFMLLAVL